MGSQRAEVEQVSRANAVHTGKTQDSSWPDLKPKAIFSLHFNDSQEEAMFLQELRGLPF